MKPHRSITAGRDRLAQAGTSRRVPAGGGSRPCQYLVVALLSLGLGVPAAAASAQEAATWWRPQQGGAWHYQLTGTPKVPEGVTVVTYDGADVTAAQVAAAKARGAQAICYFSAGSFENWRGDASRFPPAVKGKNLDGWAGERWLDVRRLDVLLPIMAARMDSCKAKGFVAVEPDNMDGYANASGFALAEADGAAYQKALAALAHSRGLAIGLKNAMDILPLVSASTDFAVNEQCRQYAECGVYSSFTAGGKPVFNVEYSGAVATVCAKVPAGFRRIKARLALASATIAC